MRMEATQHDPDSVALLLKALADHQGDDWYEALLHVALDDNGGDVAKAVAAADAAYAEQSSEPEGEEPFVLQETKDDTGHEHKGKGEGGGQFASGGGGGGASGGDAKVSGVPEDHKKKVKAVLKSYGIGATDYDAMGVKQLASESGLSHEEVIAAGKALKADPKGGAKKPADKKETPNKSATSESPKAAQSAPKPAESPQATEKQASAKNEPVPKGQTSGSTQRTARLAKTPDAVKSHAQKWASSMTPAEQDAVKAYADPEAYISGKQVAFALNDGLRTGKLSPELQKMADGLSSAIDRSGPLPGAPTTYRGVTLKPEQSAELVSQAEAALKSGGTVGFDGFTSSSLDPSYVAENFASADHSVVYEMKTKTGAYVSQFSTAGDHEKEILQKPGTKYKVVGVDRDSAFGAASEWGPDEGKHARRTVIRLEEA